MRKLLLAFFAFLSTSGSFFRPVTPADRYYDTLDAIASKVIKTQGHGLSLHNLGSITLGPATRNKYFGLWFLDDKRMTLDEGRLLAANVVEQYWGLLQSDTEVHAYIESKADYMPNIFTGKLLLDYLVVKIAYWDKNFDRPLQPYLADIRFEDNTFFYSVAEPETQALRLIYQESYEEARAFRNAHQPQSLPRT